jgi:NAD(P)-dependent dehydrogenase (short-subunit alcohol dehydrogenase family)
MSQLFSLEGRIALVTGGSRGIGRMMAGGLLKHGASVYICSRKAQDCETTARELSSLGPCHALPADISTVEGARELAQTLAGRESRLDILVNNAGAAWSAPFESFPEKGWDKVVDLNMKTPFFLTQALLPLLRESAKQRCAKVINIASIDGLSTTTWETFPYTASKAGLIHLSKRLALTLVGERIVVNCIAPGAFASDMNVLARDHGEAMARQVPAGRIGQAEDIEAAVVYLASRAGDYVVGSTLIVDGGWAHTRN